MLPWGWINMPKVKDYPPSYLTAKIGHFCTKKMHTGTSWTLKVLLDSTINYQAFTKHVLWFIGPVCFFYMAFLQKLGDNINILKKIATKPCLNVVLWLSSLPFNYFNTLEMKGSFCQMQNEEKRRTKNLCSRVTSK